MNTPVIKILLTLSLTITLLSGCSTIIQQQTNKLANSIEETVLASDDPTTIQQAIPAYLVFLNSRRHLTPHDETLLLASSRLYSAYAAAFVDSDERRARLTHEARKLALTACCASAFKLCRLDTLPFGQFKQALVQIPPTSIDMLYVLGSAWAGYLESRRSDWHVVAQLPRVMQIMTRVAAIDASYDNANVQLYLGVLNTLVPDSLGGHSSVAQKHFLHAITASGGRNLTAKMLYAKHYARLTFNRVLHDRLLNEVIKADPHAGALTLSNVIAQQQAKVLLQSAEDYF